jgi:ADP-ribose pyrophosphatase
MTKTGLEPVLVNALDWVTIIVYDDNKFLIEKQFRYGTNCEVDEFPCGIVENGEEPLDAAIRELEEGIGIRILNKAEVKYLGSVNPNAAFMTNTMHYFYVNLDWVRFVHVEKKLDEYEQIESYWMNIWDFKNMILNRTISTNKVPAMLLTGLELVFAHEFD